MLPLPDDQVNLLSLNFLHASSNPTNVTSGSFSHE